MAQPATAETVRCTKCELVHERRPDWHCPRCGSEVDLVGGPRAGSGDSDFRDVVNPFPTANRVAGGLCVAAGALGLVGMRDEWSAGTLAALASIAIGVGLLARVRWVRTLALVLTVLGALGIVVAALVSRDHGGPEAEHLVAGLQLVGFFLLLRRTAGKVAIVAGVVLWAPSLVMAAAYALHARGLL